MPSKLPAFELLHLSVMTARIEDYALIGDCHTAALVSREGSIDWLCLPRFDSGACFAALLGKPEHGRWLLAPRSEVRSCKRRYRGDTLILETEFTTAEGTVTLIDCMLPRTDEPDLVRIVAGKRGQVPMRLELCLRFDYGSIVPWLRCEAGATRAIAGPDSVILRGGVDLCQEKANATAEFTVSEGQRIPFVMMWHPSHLPMPPVLDAEQILKQTEEWWQEWSGRCTYQGPWRDAVMRSLITLKALTYAPTGSIVAAPTTSLPEKLGGVRNWDYRICWVRDATFTLYSLLSAGYKDEALAWREWLLRAVAGDPAQMNIMYGLSGERRLTEVELDWLPGYEDSRPVRIGNGAYKQFQLDVFGEMMDTLFQARRKGLPDNENAWHVQQILLTYLESAWKKPDEGIWEVRGPRRHFTHSKVMAWVAVDRWIKTLKAHGQEDHLDRWQQMRTTIHQEVCREGFNSRRNSFVQYYGSDALDASLLMIPLVGFLPPNDPRVIGTVEAIQRELVSNGFVARYIPDPKVDGLPPGEGTFLPCTFWLADCLALMGRQEEAKRILERLIGLCNDVGLISEEYDPDRSRLLGNFPQAFTHVGLINTVLNLGPTLGPAHHRGQG